MPQNVSNLCNSCNYNIAENQKSVICTICHNHYHYNKACLRLANQLDALSSIVHAFTCYQCKDDCLPFTNVNNISFQANFDDCSNNVSLNERQRLDNLVFEPLQLQPEDLTDIQTTDYICQELSSNSNSSYYSTLEFADTVQAQNIQNDRLSFIHLNIKCIRNKFDMFKHLLSGLHTANSSWQTCVGKLKLVCVNGTKTVGKHVGKLLAKKELASILANFFTNFFVLANSYLTCERLANVCW